MKKTTFFLIAFIFILFSFVGIGTQSVDAAGYCVDIEPYGTVCGDVSAYHTQQGWQGDMVAAILSNPYSAATTAIAAGGVYQYTYWSQTGCGNGDIHVTITGYCSAGDRCYNGDVYSITSSCGGAGAPSEECPIGCTSGQCIPCPTCPEPPAITATSSAACGNLVNLSWNPAARATGYVVYRSTSSGGPFSQVNNATTTATTFTDSTPIPLATYYYKVRAFNTSGKSLSSNVVNAASSQECPPIVSCVGKVFTYFGPGNSVNMVWGATVTGNATSPFTYDWTLNPIPAPFTYTATANPETTGSYIINYLTGIPNPTPTAAVKVTSFYGAQSAVTQCAPLDYCSNFPGVQATLPTGVSRIFVGNCVCPTDQYYDSSSSKCEPYTAPAACGSSAGQSFSSPPETNLCAPGSVAQAPAQLLTIDGAPQYHWACRGTGSTVVACYANPVTAPTTCTPYIDPDQTATVVNSVNGTCPITWTVRNDNNSDAGDTTSCPQTGINCTYDGGTPTTSPFSQTMDLGTHTIVCTNNTGQSTTLTPKPLCRLNSTYGEF